MRRQYQYSELLAVLPRGSRIARQVAVNDGRQTGARQIGDHAVIYLPDGSILRTESGMIIKVAGTPGDWRTRRNEISRIRRALRARR